MRKLLVWVLTLIAVSLTMLAGAQEVKEEELLQELVAQSPWQGKWEGLAYPALPLKGTFELVFKMEGGAISAAIQNTSGSATQTKFDGPVTEIKIKGNRIEFRGPADTLYELKLEEGRKLVGSMYTSGAIRGKTQLDVEFRPAKK